MLTCQEGIHQFHHLYFLASLNCFFDMAPHTQRSLHPYMLMRSQSACFHSYFMWECRVRTYTYGDVNFLFGLGLRNKGAMTRLARRLSARHEMAARHEHAEGEDAEVKPESTMAGENENTGTGVVLDRGFPMHRVQCRARYQIFNSRT